MGMRAGIIYKNIEGKSFLTTVHWSTRIDMTLGHYISQSDNPGSDVKELFETITQNYHHISALEIDNTPAEKYDVSFGVVKVVDPSKHYKNTLKNSTYKDPRNAMDDCLNAGSIGVMYDEKHSDRVTFYFESPDGEIETKNSSLSALGKFYKNVHANPHKLKKFSFRTP